MKVPEWSANSRGEPITPQGTRLVWHPRGPEGDHLRIVDIPYAERQ
jgi:hypothetical protein